MVGPTPKAPRSEPGCGMPVRPRAPSPTRGLLLVRPTTPPRRHPELADLLIRPSRWLQLALGGPSQLAYQQPELLAHGRDPDVRVHALHVEPPRIGPRAGGFGGNVNPPRKRSSGGGRRPRVLHEVADPFDHVVRDLRQQDRERVDLVDLDLRLAGRLTRPPAPDVLQEFSRGRCRSGTSTATGSGRSGSSSDSLISSERSCSSAGSGPRELALVLGVDRRADDHPQRLRLLQRRGPEPSPLSRSFRSSSFVRPAKTYATSCGDPRPCGR